MADDAQIERCAQMCDTAVAELEELKIKARKNRYDRQAEREIEYAIRAIMRVAARIRALSSLKPPG